MAFARPVMKRRARVTTALLFCAAVTGCSDSGRAPQTESTAPDPHDASPAPRASAPDEYGTIGTAAVEAPARSVHDQFWSRLETLCDQSFAGYLTIGTEPSDRDFGEAALAMHVTRCADDAIDIGFQVNEDRSRTWQLRRNVGQLSLHHDHRDPDGTPHDPTGYGGATADAGTAGRQSFPVDDATVAMLPAARGNVWTVEVYPGKTFAYELERVADERYFRVEFELNTPIEQP